VQYSAMAGVLVPGVALTASWFSSCCLHLSIRANVFSVIWMTVLEMLIVSLWFFGHGALLNRVEEDDFYFVALVALCSLEMALVVGTFIFWADHWGCSRVRGFEDRDISSSLPVPIELEDTATRWPSVCEEQGAQCTAVSSVGLASRLRLSAESYVEEQLSHSKGVSSGREDSASQSLNISEEEEEEEGAQRTARTSLGLASRLSFEATRDTEEQLSHSGRASTTQSGE